MSDLPEPLVPAEVDLRDFAFMPLDVQRLRDSDLASDETPEACWAAVLLWCASWHQLPAGSIPDSDDWQAKHAGYKAQGRIAPGWKRIRNGALRGWVPCSDGRLYHPVVAEKALESWRHKLAQRWRSEVARVKKHNQRHQTNHEMPDLDTWISLGCPLVQTNAVPKDIDPLSQGQTGNVPRETPSNRPEQTGPEQTGPEHLGTEVFPLPGEGDGDPPGVDGFKPSPAALVTRRLREAGIARANPTSQRLIALVEAGATAEEFLAFADKALDMDDPFAYLLGCVEGERKRAKRNGAELHRGRLPTKQEGIEQRNRAVADEWLAQQGST